VATLEAEGQVLDSHSLLLAVSAAPEISADVVAALQALVLSGGRSARNQADPERAVGRRQSRPRSRYSRRARRDPRVKRSLVDEGDCIDLARLLRGIRWVDAMTRRVTWVAAAQRCCSFP
jgi:hypothetical protein